MRIPAITIIGPPGAGKGTQSRLLAAYRNIKHISTGDAFRAQKDSPLAQQYAQTLRSGTFFPDEVAMRLIGQEIADRGYTSSDLVVVDGAPRTTAQVSLLDQIVDVRHVISLDSNDQELFAQRVWDRNERDYDRVPESVRTRLEDYVNKTRPVLATYRRSGRTVSSVNPDQSIPAVHAEIVRALKTNPQLVEWF